mgnify:CR=1 FL=1
MNLEDYSLSELRELAKNKNIKAEVYDLQYFEELKKNCIDECGGQNV